MSGEKGEEDFPGGSAGKESASNAGDLGSIPGLGRSPGEGNSYPLQYSGLENSVDCIVHGVAESDITERPSLNSKERNFPIMLNYLLAVPLYTAMAAGLDKRT